MMTSGKKPLLTIKSLKEQVYEFLRDELHKGRLAPGSVINMDETARKLGVSKTPLRDALLQLESESFVTILPRRGVVVRTLTLQDIKNYYEIIGNLEASALLTARENLKEPVVNGMEKLCEAMTRALSENNFELYHDRNLKFHDTYLSVCGNVALLRVVGTLKKRLYDFPRPETWIKDWEVASCAEHEAIVDEIRRGRVEDAARLLRDVHWSYRAQEPFIVRYYAGAAQVRDAAGPPKP